MSATKTITLASGGTLTLTTSNINYFDAAEHETKLLTDIAAACKAYERKAQATAGNGASDKAREEAGR